MKRKNKGFTLIELIVTISLLVIIGTIITTNLVGLNNKQKAKEKTRTESIIAAAAESYLGAEDIDMENGSCITTKYLVEKNYLKESSIPTEYLNSSVTKDSNGEYTVYLYSDQCIHIDPDRGVGASKKTHTLTYMKMDNKNVLITEKFKEGKVKIKSTSESKTGYKFTGWSTSANGKVTYEANKEYRLKGKNYNLYPIWQKEQYTVTYNYNDGKTKNKTQKADYNTSMNLPTPKREGYKFLGWKVGSTSTLVNKDYTVTSNVTLTAQWMELVPITIHAGTYDSIEVNGNKVALSKLNKNYDIFYLDAENISTAKIKINLMDKYKDIAYRFNLEQIDSSYSQYSIKNIQKSDYSISFDTEKINNSENKEIIIDPYLNFEIYTPVSKWIGYISHIVTENVEYEYLDVADYHETFNNTDYQIIRFKVYDLEKANVNIMFKKKASSYVDKSDNFELISDDMSSGGYVEYVVNYDFENAAKSIAEDKIGFYYQYKFDYDHAGTKGSWQGPKYYGLYDTEVTYGGYVSSGTDTYSTVNIFSSDFEAKLYIVTRPEESDGGSTLYSYRPTGYACGSFENVSEEYGHFELASDWNGDEYIISYVYTSDSFKNNGVCKIGSEMYVSGRGPSSESGNESCGAGCVEFDSDGDFIQGSD